MTRIFCFTNYSIWNWFFDQLILFPRRFSFSKIAHFFTCFSLFLILDTLQSNLDIAYMLACCSELWNMAPQLAINGLLLDPVTWSRIDHSEPQVTQWALPKQSKVKLVWVPLFWKFHSVTCIPSRLILYHVIRLSKGSLTCTCGLWAYMCSYHCWDKL